MAIFGDFPGVKLTTEGGTITSIEVGEEEKLVLFGEADLGVGSASANDPTQIAARREADTKFGSGSELADAMRESLANGANIELLYGVAVDTTTVSGENFTSSSGTLANNPIVEDASTITVTQDPGGTAVDFTVSFAYESPPSNPGNSDDTVYINPHTGEWVADPSTATDDYDFDYDYQDWSSAFDAADTVVEEGETGIYVALSESSDVASTLDTKVQELRPDYQMVVGFSAAEPNQTGADDGAEYDTANYTDSIDSDDYFLFAPVRLDSSTQTILGGIGGLFSSSSLTQPVFNDQVLGFNDSELEQRFTKTNEDEMREEEVIPVRQAGSIRVKDNLSTSTETDWERDYWRRRIVDRVVLIVKGIGDNTVGAINDERTRAAAERSIRTELESLANDRVLKPNTDEETNFFVDVYESTTNDDQVNIDVGVTPQGIVKQIEATVTIDTN